MKKSLFATFIFVLSAACFDAMPQQVSFSGSSQSVFEEQPVASTGLDRIYVVNGCDGVSMDYTQRNAGAAVTWYEYGERGGGFGDVRGVGDAGGEEEEGGFPGGGGARDWL